MSLQSAGLFSNTGLLPFQFVTSSKLTSVVSTANWKEMGKNLTHCEGLDWVWVSVGSTGLTWHLASGCEEAQVTLISLAMGRRKRLYVPAMAGMSKGRSDGEVKHNQQRSHKNMEISHAKKMTKSLIRLFLLFGFCSCSLWMSPLLFL